MPHAAPNEAETAPTAGPDFAAIRRSTTGTPASQHRPPTGTSFRCPSVTTGRPPVSGPGIADRRSAFPCLRAVLPAGGRRS